MRFVLPVCLALYSLAGGGHSALAQEPAPPTPLTEADALARLMRVDPRVTALRAGVEEVRAAQVERTLWPNPVVAFSREAAAGASDLYLAGRQELPLSGRLGHLRTAGTFALEAAEADAAFELRDLQAGVRRAFATLLVMQERETALRHSAGEFRELLDVLRLREDAGEGSRYDRLRGERALADLEHDLEAAAIARARARVALAALLDLPDAGLVVHGWLEPGPPPPVSLLLDRALASRSDYQALDAAARQYAAEQRAAAALRLPTPTVGYGLKRSETGTRTGMGSQLSVEIAVPLFNRGRSAVALATTRVARTDAERTFLRRQIDAEVRAAHLTLTMEQARARRYEAAVADVAAPLAAIARVAYEEGELGILELLDASRQLIEARLRALDLAVATRLAAIELDRVTGAEVTP